MTKVKEKLYEHRYGLIFFAVLIVYNFIANSFKWGEITNVTYAFHLMDYSIGFCTKLLSGAICNLLFENITEEKLMLYFSFLILLCFFLVSLLLNKVIKKAEENKRKEIFIYSMFFLTGALTFGFHFEILLTMDFYWLFFSILSLFALMRKETYILVVPLMLAAVMVHYAAIICYIPFIAIIMLYKISHTVDKKERVYLWILWVLLVISTIGLSLYMMTNETDNLKITMEEMNNFLSSKGVTEDSLEYYQFAFFRDEKIQLSWNEYFTDGNVISDINKEENQLIIALQMLVQQIQITFALSDVSLVLEYLLFILPVVGYLFWTLFSVCIFYRKDTLKKFSIFCSVALFFFTLIFGKILSSDIIRWVSNALIPLFAFFFYVIYKENKELDKHISKIFSKIPLSLLVVYYIFYALIF